MGSNFNKIKTYKTLVSLESSYKIGKFIKKNELHPLMSGNKLKIGLMFGLILTFIFLTGCQNVVEWTPKDENSQNSAPVFSEKETITAEKTNIETNNETTNTVINNNSNTETENNLETNTNIETNVVRGSGGGSGGGSSSGSTSSPTISTPTPNPAPIVEVEVEPENETDSLTKILESSDKVKSAVPPPTIPNLGEANEDETNNESNPISSTPDIFSIFSSI